MKKDFILYFKCIGCRRDLPNSDRMIYTCPDCGSNLDVIYDFKCLKKEVSRKDIEESRDFTIFRYRPFLPIKSGTGFEMALNIGWTPVFQAARLRKELGLKNLFIKDDGRNPSASFKDRASAIGIIRAMELGEELITAASTGNAASSLSCLSAPLGIKNVIFVPASAPKAKVAQLLIFGARVIAVQGTYDNAFDLSWEATKRFGWYSRNTGINPYLSEGKKTGALEIAEQFNWDPPEFVFIPVGDGCIIGGIYKGFKDFLDAGFIKRIPKIIAVQAEGSAAIYNAWKSKKEIKPVSSKTV
ncbi:MAG TPA: pyridoxal-phosphate dependent enzyme, partial [Firmicutes bacterium]|nr:pyridoxal-phosphate dependent enzyme [Bacillota bacterium]